MVGHQTMSSLGDNIPIEWTFVEARLISQLEANPSILVKIDEETILHKAVMDGYAGYATKIIELRPSLVSFPNDDGNTPLHLAAKIGDKGILLKMLESGGADCLKINKRGQTAFMVACLNHHVDAAITLIEGTSSKMMVELTAAFSRQKPAIIDCILENPSILEKIYKDKYKKTETILHKVMTEGYEEYAKKIIDIFPSLISFTNEDGNTPLHLAAQNGNQSILWNMLESGAADCMKINNQGQTAFILACLNSHIDAAIILVQGTSLMTMAELYAAIISRQPDMIIDRILVKFPNLVFETDEEQSTLLHKAMTDGYDEYARRIIDHYPLLVSFTNKDGNTPLHLAVQTGNKCIILKMLDSGGEACMKINKDGNTPLHLAAQTGNKCIILKMLDSGGEACMKITNKQGHTAFILACLNNHVDAAKILVKGASFMTMLEFEAAISRRQPGIIDCILDNPSILVNIYKDQYKKTETILHKAVTDGYEEYAKKIIDFFPSLVSFTNEDGNTPLHLAAQIGNKCILLKMLESGEAACMKINDHGQTAFILACLNNHIDAARILVQGMSSLTTTELYAAIISRQPDMVIDRILVKFPNLVFEADEEQSTLLHKAVTDGYDEHATKIIDRYPSLVSFINHNGNTPLHLAAQTGNQSILSKMLKSGDAACMEMINKQGHTAFNLACLNNHVDAARILVEAASSMTMVDLDAAFSRQQPGIIDKILERFAYLASEEDEEQSTLLHKACKSGNLEMAKTLLDVDQEIAEKVNKDGLTPLHYVAINGSVEILKEFLDKAPSSFNATTQGTSETVFHLAAKHKNTKVLIFMAQSANIGNIGRQLLYNVDAEDNTVLHVAASVDSTSLVRYILMETTIDVTLKNKKGFAAVDLLNKDGVDFHLLSLWFRQDAEKIKRPSRYVKFAHESGELIRNTNSVERKISASREVEIPRDPPRNKQREMHSESLQNARNTITIVAVLIASVAFTSGITPPGGVYQEGPFIGKATAGSTLAFKIFSVTNNIALFTSLSIVTLLVSIISYTTKSLKMFVFIAHKMMWLAVASMATAYAAAAWITVPHQKGSKWLVYTTSAIASVALGSMFVYGSFMMVKHILKKGLLNRSLSHGKAASATLDLEAAGDAGCYGF